MHKAQLHTNIVYMYIHSYMDPLGLEPLTVCVCLEDSEDTGREYVSHDLKDQMTFNLNGFMVYNIYIYIHIASCICLYIYIYISIYKYIPVIGNLTGLMVHA